jgi:transcriptional regulator
VADMAWPMLAPRKARVDQRLIHAAIALRKQGKTQEEIATELGVVQGTISIILRAHGWGGQLIRGTKRRQR